MSLGGGMRPGPARPDGLLVAALAGFFVVVQFYTSFAALSQTPPVGYVFAGRGGAAALIGLLALSALVCVVRLARERAWLSRTSLAIVGAWIGSALVSSLAGLDPAFGLQVVGMMLLAAAFHLALVRWYPCPPVARAVLGSYLFVGVLAAAASLVMLATRLPAPLWAANSGRAAGFFVTANQFAAFLIAFVYVALGVALAAEDAALRSLGIAGVAFGACALVATFSQSGWLGALAGAVFLSCALRARQLAAGLILVTLTGALLVSLRPAAHHNPAGSVDRLRTWTAGLRVAELFPLTGVGPMAYYHVYPEVRPPNGDEPGTFGALHPHNVFLSLAGDTGALGAAAFVAGWTIFARTVYRSLARAEPRRKRLGFALCAALVATFAQGMFDTVGIVVATFVWMPYTALALAAARHGLPAADGSAS